MKLLAVCLFIATFSSHGIFCEKVWSPVRNTRASTEVGGKPDISPVFRRKPLKPASKSTTEEPAKKEDKAEVEDRIEEDPEDEDKFTVGVEHYLDVEKENDEEIVAKEPFKESSTNSDDDEEEVFYDNDDYYYEEEYEEDPEEYQRRKRYQERIERMKELKQKRKEWIQKQRQRYFESLSKWRKPKVVIPDRPPRPVPDYHHKPPRPLGNDNRRHYEPPKVRSRENGESTSFMRSILGVNPFCIHDEAQFSCTFTPLCWMQGGVAMGGCDSMLYSCCVSHTIARRKDTFIETGRAQKRRFKEILHNEPECGITKHRQFAKRIIGGQKAKFAELPWQVHIRISSYQCGGVLLNHLYVATAAHCVHQAKLSQITVHLGEYDTKNTQKTAEPLDSESFRVDHITLHPDFRYMLTQPDRFDIAVLKLDRPVEYHDNILPICLPTSDTDLVGKIGVVAGWGKTDNSFGKTGTNILHKVLVPIIDNHKCRGWHRDKAIAVQLHDEMFCAGHKEGKQDACLGDSGGPLVINFDGRWTLIGITSAGFGCAVEKQPGIYHKVSKTAKWISQQINKDSPRR